MREWLLQKTRLTPNGAWLLGYLWSDGCVNNQLGRISFECTFKDRELLKQVKEIVQCVHTVRDLKPRQIRGRIYKGCNLQIYSKKLTKDAVKWGIIPHRSSLDVLFPDIGNQYLHHFLRGYLDGDGCVSVQRSSDCKYPTVKVYWIGSPNFILGLRKKVDSYLRIPDSGRVNAVRGVRCVQWAARKDVRKLYAWLYPTDDVHHLRRKRLKILKVFE